MRAAGVAWRVTLEVDVVAARAHIPGAPCHLLGVLRIELQIPIEDVLVDRG
jgi:hypothetical protein